MYAVQVGPLDHYSVKFGNLEAASIIDRMKGFVCIWGVVGPLLHPTLLRAAPFAPIKFLSRPG
jgi:hypothetical protein